MSSPVVAIEREALDAVRTVPSGLVGPVRTVELFRSFADAAPAWRELEPVAPCSPYGRLAWADAWHATIGMADGVELCIVVGRDRGGRAAVLLPLGLRRWGPLTVAAFLGGKDSNGNLGLFAEPAMWTPDAVRALIDAAATRAGIDLFALRNQPEGWDGERNPLLALHRQPSPSPGRSGTLYPEPERTLKTRLSKHARKQFRQKEARLRAERPLGYRVARSADEIEEGVAAYMRQRSERAQATGAPLPDAALAAFLSRGARPTTLDDSPALELHALVWGQEIIAVLGGAAHRGRFSGMVLAFDPRPEIARNSPGELLVATALADLGARGVTTFDLGIGEARYKATFCDTVEPMFDSFIGISAVGRGVARAASWRAAAKRRIKQSPRVWRVLQGLRAAWPRFGLSRR